MVTSALWHLLSLIARDSLTEATTELMRMLVTESGAEHVSIARATQPNARLYESEGKGSRLAVSGVRGMFVLEHRSRRAAFDAVSPEVLERWATLADLVKPDRRRPTEKEQRAEVTAALKKTGGNITHAAALLGLSRLGLKKRMVRLGLRDGSS